MNLFRSVFNDLSCHRISKLYGDGSFDAFEVYEKFIERKITPVIKPDKTAVVHYSNRSNLPRDLKVLM